jgi:hypothetical protein
MKVRFNLTFSQRLPFIEWGAVDVKRILTRFQRWVPNIFCC